MRLPQGVRCDTSRLLLRLRACAWFLVGCCVRCVASDSLGGSMIDNIKIGEGITVGVKKTIAAPDGTRIKSFGIKLVPGGVAIGMQTTDKAGHTTDYAATLD